MKQRKILFTIIIALLCVFFLISYKDCSFSMENSKLTSKDKLKEDDFNISGVKLGQPIIETLKLLGKPEKILNGEKGDEYENYYYFKGILIATSKTYPGKVGYISIKKKELKTFRGIEIGSKQEDVFYRYGKTEIVNDGYTYEKKYDGLNTSGIIFIVKQGKVKEIIISFLSMN